MKKEEEEKASYYMIIPAVVWDSDIKDKAKLTYGHITCLAHKEGYCWSNNKYFAKQLGCSTASVSRYISELEKLGVIKTKLIYKENSKEVKQRRIYLSSVPTDRIVEGPTDRIDSGPTDQIDRDNTTSNNNINTNSNDVPSTEVIKSKMFFKLVDLYPKNRIGNRQHVLKHYKKLSIEECKLSLVNLNRYLECAGAYVKSLSNYITQECYSEEWLNSEEQTKQKKTTKTTNTKTFTQDYDNIS